MATEAEAAQKYDQIKADLATVDRKARGAILAARSAQNKKDEVFADADLKAKVKAIADARGESITGFGNNIKNASDAAVALLPFYPDPEPEPEPAPEV